MLEKKMKAVYRPRGRAREYSEWALNLSIGFTHGCKYCYAPKVVRKSKEEFHAAAPVRGGIFEKLERGAP
jgi:DNA repair photolyase